MAAVLAARKTREVARQADLSAWEDSLLPEPADRLPSDPGDPFWFGGNARPIMPGVATQRTLAGKVSQCK